MHIIEQKYLNYNAFQIENNKYQTVTSHHDHTLHISYNTDDITKIHN